MSRGRGSVPALYGAVSLVLVAGALTVALSSPPPSTPPLAEVAPAPQENIDVERVEQSSRFGEGAGGGEGDCAPQDPGCDGGAEAPDPTMSEQPGPQESPSLTSAAQSWPCRNRGQTQTDDPQSPPCIGSRFEGENGGATATGVTGTEIRVAWPTVLDENGNPSAHDREVEDAILAHVNKSYELYDRTIVLELVDVSGFERTPAGQRALAQEVASREVFASLGAWHLGAPFHRTLAEAGVVSVISALSAPVDEALLTELHPYVWSVAPTIGESMRTSAALICEALVDRPAQHGGDGVATITRRFGLLIETDDGHRIDPAALRTGLDACDARYQVAEHDRDAEGASGNLETTIRRMQADGVTTVVCVCDGLLPSAQEAAGAAGYLPEWFVPGLDDDQIGKVGRDHRDQRDHVFGLTPNFRRPATTSTNTRSFEGDYWYHAMKDGDPDVETGSELRPFYQELLVLAAGIQWAGPELTAASFGRALTDLEFANPGVGRAPWFQPAVHLGSTDHGWNSDFALIWWDNSTAEQERVSPTYNGSACYVEDGQRFTIDTLPPNADDLLFDPESGCR